MRTFVMTGVLAAVFVGGAQAGTFTGSAAFNDKNQGGDADFTAPDAGFDLTTLLNAGDSVTIQDFLVVTTTDIATKTNTQIDDLTLTFQFALPSHTKVVLDGVGTESVTISRLTDAANGSIDWDNSGEISASFADDSLLDIGLSFDPLNSIFFTTNGNQDLTLAFNATFTLAQVANTRAVPEPASLPLLVMGLAGLGLVVRARRV